MDCHRRTTTCLPSVLQFVLVSALVWTGFSLHGCVSQQADLKQTERELQRRMKQQTEELAQNRARQNQEIISLREQDIPSIRENIKEMMHRIQAIEARQQDATNKISTQKRRDENTNFRSKLTDADLKSCEARLEQHDELITSLLMKVQELSQLVKSPRNE